MTALDRFLTTAKSNHNSIVTAPPAKSKIAEELERLRAENAALKAQAAKPAKAITIKVSPKGGISVYGLGRFPVTLYQEQWIKILDMADQIRAFIRDNAGKLSTKGEQS